MASEHAELACWALPFLPLPYFFHTAHMHALHLHTHVFAQACPLWCPQAESGTPYSRMPAPALAGAAPTHLLKQHLRRAHRVGGVHDDGVIRPLLRVLHGTANHTQHAQQVPMLAPGLPG